MEHTLNEIVEGHHNRSNCLLYQAVYKREYGKSTHACKFKADPSLISRLLTKLVVGPDGKVEVVISPVPLCNTTLHTLAANMVKSIESAEEVNQTLVDQLETHIEALSNHLNQLKLGLALE